MARRWYGFRSRARGLYRRGRGYYRSARRRYSGMMKGGSVGRAFLWSTLAALVCKRFAPQFTAPAAGIAGYLGAGDGKSMNNIGTGLVCMATGPAAAGVIDQYIPSSIGGVQTGGSGAAMNF